MSCEETCEKVRKRQRGLLGRTLTQEEIDVLLGPEGEGIEFDPEVWKEMQKKLCDESTTE